MGKSAGVSRNAEEEGDVLTSNMLTHAASAAFALLLVSAPAAAESHVNEEAGYRISIPRDFEKRDNAEFVVNGATLSGGPFFGGQYLLDRFLCSKEIFPKEMPWGYRRELRTFFFPRRTAAEIAAAREAAREQDAGSTKSAVVVRAGDGEIFLTFEDYAKASIQGFFFEEEKEVKVAGFPAKLYEMKFEKLTNVPQRWIACSYQVDEGEFAILMTCTEQHFKQYRNEANKAFSSLRILDGGLKVKDLQTTMEVEADDVDEDELTAEELLARRETQKREAYDKTLEALESGWRSFETDHFLIVYACKPSYAKTVARHGEAVIDWLEENFGAIGTGHVQGMIIKVYDQPEDVPNRWTIDFGKGRVPHIVFARPDSRGYNSEFQGISLNVLQHWFSEKNDQLWKRMPAWLSSGLYEYVEDAELKGSRLSFDTDEWEKDSMVDARNAQKRHEGNEAAAPLKPLKLVMTMPSDQLFAGRRDFARTQCSSFVRYLLEGPGSKNKKTGVILSHYLGHLLELVEEVEKRIAKEKKEAEAREKAMETMTDEEKLAAEDEAYKKKREQAYDKVATELLTKAFERTFTGWEDSDWRSLDSSWMKYAEGRTR